MYNKACSIVHDNGQVPVGQCYLAALMSPAAWRHFSEGDILVPGEVGVGGSPELDLLDTDIPPEPADLSDWFPRPAGRHCVSCCAQESLLCLL